MSIGCDTFPNSAKQTVCQHQWVDVSEKPETYLENRRCLICELEDVRHRDPVGRHYRNDWKVETPCIEPVSKTVSYEDLVRELAENKVRAKPWVVGVPGDWTVGFFIGGNEIFPFPMLVVKAPKTIEHGFAKLLRWVRARQYVLGRYSQFDEMCRRAHTSHCCCDDDF